MTEVGRAHYKAELIASRSHNNSTIQTTTEFADRQQHTENYVRVWESFAISTLMGSKQTIFLIYNIANLVLLAGLLLYAWKKVTKLRHTSATYTDRLLPFAYFSFIAWTIWVLQYAILVPAPLISFPTGSLLNHTGLGLGLMQNGLWASAVLSLYPKPVSRKLLSLPVLLMFVIVSASFASGSLALPSETFALIDAISSAVIFTAFVFLVLQWQLSWRLVVPFFIHGCSHWIWRSVWFTPLAETQIAALIVFPLWGSALLYAWIKLISAMVDRPQASFENAVKAIKQLQLPNPLNTFIVMISSTVKDLKRERDAAEQAIIGLHLQCFRAEKMGTVSLSPREFCELMAKQCNLFILIIGEYYGHIIDPEGISVVESEYNVARDENPRKVLVFEKDGVERDKRLDDFLNSLRNYNDGYPTSSFTTPEELAEQIPPAVMLWLTKLAQQNNQEVWP